MNDLKNILRDIGYFGVGAAAVILEVGGKAVKCLVKKGENTLRENQDTVDDLKRKAKDLGDKVKDAVEKATKPEEPTVEEPIVEEPVVDEPIAEAPIVEEPIAEASECLCEPKCDEPARPVAPDVIYHPSEPVPEEAEDENSING